MSGILQGPRATNFLSFVSTFNKVNRSCLLAEKNETCLNYDFPCLSQSSEKDRARIDRVLVQQ